MLDWKDPVGSSENTDHVAVSSHNHQDKKGKALEMTSYDGKGGGGDYSVTASSWLRATCNKIPAL